MEPTLGANIISKKMEEIKAQWATHNQDHVFKWADKLTEQERVTFLEDLQQVDVTEINKIYKETVAYEGITYHIHVMRKFSPLDRKQ
jgi:hypothetical protein